MKDYIPTAAIGIRFNGSEETPLEYALRLQGGSVKTDIESLPSLPRLW